MKVNQTAFKVVCKKFITQSLNCIKSYALFIRQTSYMTLPAHDRAFLFFTMAAFAIGMKGLHQAGYVAVIFKIMAIRAALIFRWFILQLLAVFIDVMAFIAFFDLSQFIVFVVSENSRWSFWASKNFIFNMDHIFLGMSRYQDRQKACQHCKDE